MFTKIGSFLGTLAFAMMVTVGAHQKIEVDKINASLPPTLTQLMNNTVKLNAGGEICSGWVLQGTNKVITAAHCFNFTAAASGADAPEAIVTFMDGHQDSFKVVKITTDSGDDMHDWAVLEPVGALSQPLPGGLPACVDKPFYGQDIVVVGAGLDYWPEVNFGKISNPNFKADPDAAGTEHSVILDAKVLPGNSGGPVIDTANGCVIGTAEEIDTHRMGGLQGVNIAAPVYGDNLINWMKS